MTNPGWTTLELIALHYQDRKRHIDKMSVNDLHNYRRELEADIRETAHITERHRDDDELFDLASQMHAALKRKHERVLDAIEQRGQIRHTKNQKRSAEKAKKALGLQQLYPNPKRKPSSQQNRPTEQSANIPPVIHKPLAPDSPVKKLSWSVLSEKLLSFPVMRNYLRLNYRPAAGQVVDLERLEYLYSFSPTDIYMGRDEFEGYFVVDFRQHQTAVFECPVIGNALYLVRGSWQLAARKSKTELLHSDSKDIRRIIHIGEWKERVLQALTSPNMNEL